MTARIKGLFKKNANSVRNQYRVLSVLFCHSRKAPIASSQQLFCLNLAQCHGTGEFVIKEFVIESGLGRVHPAPGKLQPFQPCPVNGGEAHRARLAVQ